MIWSDSCQTARDSGWIVTLMDTRQPAVTLVALPGGGALGVTTAPVIHSGSTRVADGAAWFWLRPPSRGDLASISDMWESCSLATRIGRFHAPVRDIPASYLDGVLSDPSTSLVAVHGSGGAVAGLASLIPGSGGSAELGVLVEDAWQRRGIGRQLVAQLIASAHQVTELTASVLAQNAAVADLLRQVPGEFSLTRDGTTVHVRVLLNSAGPGP
jgi:GNAT superfamily N-acetyltransferase